MTDELRAKFDLLPCPFCGNTEDDFEGSPWPLNREMTSWIVRCGNPSCNAEVIDESPEMAASRWNRRASRDAEVEALKRDADAFKNFHRLLCQRFDYVHDEKDWRRDQLSLIEHIVKSKYTANGELQYFVDGLGWVVRCQDFWKYLQVRAEELKIIDAAMAKESGE